MVSENEMNQVRLLLSMTVFVGRQIIQPNEDIASSAQKANQVVQHLNEIGYLEVFVEAMK